MELDNGQWADRRANKWVHLPRAPAASGRAAPTLASPGMQHLPDFLPEKFREWGAGQVATWLRQGLGRVIAAELFARHDINGTVATTLTDDNLRFAVGIEAPLERLGLLLAIKAMLAEKPRSLRRRLEQAERVMAASMRSTTGAGPSLMDALPAADGNHLWWRWVAKVMWHDSPHTAGTSEADDGDEDLTRSVFAPWREHVRHHHHSGWQLMLDDWTPHPLLPLDLRAGPSPLLDTTRSYGPQPIFSSPSSRTLGVQPSTTVEVQPKQTLHVEAASARNDGPVAEGSLAAAYRRGKTRSRLGFSRDEPLSGPERDIYEAFCGCDRDGSGLLSRHGVKILVEKMLGRRVTTRMIDNAMSVMKRGAEQDTSRCSTGAHGEQQQQRENSRLVNFMEFYTWYQTSLVQQFVASIPLFQDLSLVARTEMATVMKRRRYDGGELIITQGAQDSSMYILASGEAIATLDSKTTPARATVKDAWGHWILKRYEVVRLPCRSMPAPCKMHQCGWIELGCCKYRACALTAGIVIRCVCCVATHYVQGSYFGEVALLQQSPRTANVRTVGCIFSLTLTNLPATLTGSQIYVARVSLSLCVCA
jgi:CRP-like cAMP-binding protein